jgi:hypothetical protein
MVTASGSPPFQLLARERQRASDQDVPVAAIGLPAQPAATGTAFHANRRTIRHSCPARAGATLAAARQAGLHNPITYFPLVLVNPPFRGAKVRSATVPGTIGTGNLMVPAGPPGAFTGEGGPASVVA